LLQSKFNFNILVLLFFLISTRPPPSLATIIEDESLIIQSTRQISDKSAHILSQRHDNTSEGLSDTVMSSLLAQDESSQHDNIHITTKTIPSEGIKSYLCLFFFK
jgi:hypothetical protein